ncbi:hypothetical protein Adt_25138 [Abeliophyllum distichum]|uniref:Uncharacterized protein n=1 Tax=Abeliophyllum distichum TaxID=126358 RepID=A0ABD1SGT8_9LAMI
MNCQVFINSNIVHSLPPDTCNVRKVLVITDHKIEEELLWLDISKVQNKTKKKKQKHKQEDYILRRTSNRQDSIPNRRRSSVKLVEIIELPYPESEEEEVVAKEKRVVHKAVACAMEKSNEGVTTTIGTSNEGPADQIETKGEDIATGMASPE